MLRSKVTHIIFLVIITAAVYANSVGGEFVYDDKAMISAYDLVKDIRNVPLAFVSATSVYGNVNYYRPLQTVSYMTDHFLWGDLPAGFHVTNILLHMAAAVCVYALIRMLFPGAALAFMTALLFAVHPAATGVVSYIAGRADAMLMTFTAICIMFHIRARYGGGGPLSYVLAVVSFCAALLCKELAMMIPVFLVVLDKYARRYTRLGEPRYGDVYYTPFVLALAGYLVFRFTSMSFFAEGAVPPLPLYNRIITVPYAIAQYFRLVVLPNDLHMGRDPWVAGSPLDERVIASIAVTVLVIGAVYLARKKQGSAWFGMCWFLLMIVPSLNVITPLFYTFAENWLYIPSAGLFLVVSSLVVKGYDVLARTGTGRLKYAAVAAFTVFAAALSAVTVRQNLTWKDEIALGTNTLRFNPREFKIYNNMGVAYLGRGDLDKAEESFLKCLEIKPDTGMAYFNLYRVYMAEGKRTRAVECLDKARELDPQRVGILIKKMGIKD